MAAPREATGRSSGKVILLGEHSVVHGHPALAAGIGLGVDAKAEACPHGQSRLIVAPWGLDLAPTSEQPLGQAFAALLESYGREYGARIKLDVHLPGGAGLGCSAAMGVAACVALDGLYEIERSAEERADAALVWERVFHGNPSGVDNAMSACGGVAIFRRGEPLEHLQVARPLPLVIAHSGESSSTKEVVAMVARQKDRDPKRVGQAFDAITALVRNARLAVEAGDLKSVGQLMSMNQTLLSGLMLSTERIEDLCRAAESAESLGAKLTGAGAGGCVIALGQDMDHARAIQKAMAPHASMSFTTQAGLR
ncbi:MAG: mevalonate kinase [Polyangiales bacterium]|jgi:mevalonate kinase